MKYTEAQKTSVLNLIEKAKQIEYVKFNSVIENAVNEWKNGVKTDQEAYNKIYKKVIKNEHYLAHRYADLDIEKALRTLAEIFTDDIISMEEFMELDTATKEAVHSYTGIKIA